MERRRVEERLRLKISGFSAEIAGRPDVYLGGFGRPFCSEISTLHQVNLTSLRLPPSISVATISGGDGMSITPFLAGRRFEPELAAIMTGAFALACKALRLSEENDPLMPLVAQHIIGLGERGFRDRIVVYLLTLASLNLRGELGFYQE
jgi:hypothetical protein